MSQKQKVVPVAMKNMEAGKEYFMVSTDSDGRIGLGAPFTVYMAPFEDDHGELKVPLQEPTGSVLDYFSTHGMAYRLFEFTPAAFELLQVASVELNTEKTFSLHMRPYKFYIGAALEHKLSR